MGEPKILTREEVESLEGFTGTCWEAERSGEHFAICDRLTGDVVIDASGWQDELPSIADARLMTWAPNLRATCLHLFNSRTDIANGRAEWVTRAMLAEKQVERLRSDLATLADRLERCGWRDVADDIGGESSYLDSPEAEPIGCDTAHGVNLAGAMLRELLEREVQRG